MATQNWKVTMILQINEGSNPNDWVNESVCEALESGEDILHYDCVMYDGEIPE